MWQLLLEPERERAWTGASPRMDRVSFPEHSGPKEECMGAAHYQMHINGNWTEADGGGIESLGM